MELDHRSNTNTIIMNPPSHHDEPGNNNRFLKSIIDTFRRKRGAIIIATLILVVSVSLFFTFWIFLRPSQSQFSLFLSASYSKNNNPNTIENYCVNYTLSEPLKIMIANPNEADLVIGSLNISIYYHHTTKVWTTMVNGPIHVGSMKVKMMFGGMEEKSMAHKMMDDDNLMSWEKGGGLFDPSKNSHLGMGDFIVEMSVVRAKFKRLAGLFTWTMNWDLRCNILDISVSNPDGHKWYSTGFGFCQD